MVLRAQQIVEGLKTPLIGVVLNQVPLNAGGDYGYYTNNYAYYSDASGCEARGSARCRDARANPKTLGCASPERIDRADAWRRRSPNKRAIGQANRRVSKLPQKRSFMAREFAIENRRRSLGLPIVENSC